MDGESVIAAVGGCSAAAVLARYAISRALADLEKITGKVNELSEAVAVLSVRLEKLKEHDNMLKEHEEKLSRLAEVKSHERHRPSRAQGSF